MKTPDLDGVEFIPVEPPFDFSVVAYTNWEGQFSCTSWDGTTEQILVQAKPGEQYLRLIAGPQIEEACVIKVIDQSFLSTSIIKNLAEGQFVATAFPTRSIIKARHNLMAREEVEAVIQKIFNKMIDDVPGIPDTHEFLGKEIWSELQRLKLVGS